MAKARRCPSPLKLPPLALLLLLSLASARGAVETFHYLSYIVEHAREALADEFGSLVQCARRCLHTPACVKFSRDHGSGLCRLWPLHSADNPLTADMEPLYQPPLPAGFVRS